MWSKKFTLKKLILGCCLFIQKVHCEDEDSSLYGTWSSKSNQVFTGPGFYDPVDELLIEPSLPGLSYSFTEDGYYEEATYQVSSNPKDPTCPMASLIYQHGTYNISDNGTLVLNPFQVDGRQLFSDPCTDDGVSTYSRYNQTETFKEYTVGIDAYHGVYTLQLYQYDGTPMQPLYLAYRPPMMLPTETLNPTSSAASTDDASTSSNKKRSLRQLVRRSLENRHKTNAVKRPNASFLTSSAIWYLSAGMLGVGSLLFLAF
ncbi:rot1p [Saccharomyces arboricola H-6]|uniref:Protein ROT1 n=1 Tax=Saccharomyces arboricola (strain H-6 / AS 2.3317 / CBS 10644) TaxID=1160507 RepID=J8PPW8_SACAR|nr:rot1p [Saccharomyces arboricola H-6]